MVLATAGSVGTGSVDPINDIADICGREGLWLHVDGAYGAMAAAVPDAEPDLKRDWERVRGNSSLSWENAKDATRDAWQRMSDAVERAVPGDSDRDGK